jgi:hypothetical protein
LHKKFINAINSNKALDADDLSVPGQRGVTVDKHGNVKIEAGTAQDVMERYGGGRDEADSHNQKVY